jgi:hypothetical protein
MALTLQLTDGTTTLDLIANAAYALAYNEWVPAVSRIKANYMAGSDEYEDVIEQIPITVRGATGSAALANLDAIVRLLVQAERWRRGENVAAVRMQWLPTASGMANPVEAIVLGVAPGEQLIYAPPQMIDFANYEIPGVVIKLQRRGRWLANSESSAASASTTNGDLATISLGSALNLPSPTRLTVTNFGYGKSTGGRMRNAILLLAETSTDIAIINAESMAYGRWTSVADSAAAARNTNVLRYTPTSLGEDWSTGSGAVSLTSGMNLLAVFANVRNSTSTDFRFHLRVDSDLPNNFTPWVYVKAESVAYPRWVFCGLVPKSGAVTNVYVSAVASAASSYMDIDTIVLADARTVKIFGIDGPSETDLNFSCALATLDVNHNLLTLPAPTAVSGSIPAPHQGDIIFSTKAASLYGLLLGTGDTSNAFGLKWRQYSGGVAANVWTAYRRTAYITPL